MDDNAGMTRWRDGGRRLLARFIKRNVALAARYNSYAPSRRIEGQFGGETMMPELSSVIFSFSTSRTVQPDDFQDILSCIEKLCFHDPKLIVRRCGYYYWSNTADEAGICPPRLRHIPTRKLLENWSTDKDSSEYAAVFLPFTRGSLQLSPSSLMFVFTDCNLKLPDEGQWLDEMKWYKKHKNRILFVIKENGATDVNALIKCDGKMIPHIIV